MSYPTPMDVAESEDSAANALDEALDWPYSREAWDQVDAERVELLAANEALSARLADTQAGAELLSRQSKAYEARLAEAERLLTREEFQSELEALAINKPSAALRALMTIPFETWAKHLQADACKRIGVTPVQMFRRTTATAAASPQAAGESRDA